jgi:hypothetical protein
MTTSRTARTGTARTGTAVTGRAVTGRELFVITVHKVRDRSPGGTHDWMPYGVQHAWRPGERRTLCGEWTVGWTVFWERAFSGRPGPGSPTCPACVEATLPEASRRRLDRFERAS